MLSPKVVVFLALIAARINASTNLSNYVYEPLWTAAYEAENALTVEELKEARTALKLFDSVSYFGWICKWVAPFPALFD